VEEEGFHRKKGPLVLVCCLHVSRVYLEAMSKEAVDKSRDVVDEVVAAVVSDHAAEDARVEDEAAAAAAAEKANVYPSNRSKRPPLIYLPRP